MSAVRKTSSSPTLSTRARRRHPGPAATRRANSLANLSLDESIAYAESQCSFFGIVESVADALVLVEAARRGDIPLWKQRVPGPERAEKIVSGSVFVFEKTQDLKRWTDGLDWSPSRVIGPFLVYRQPKKDGSENHEPVRAPVYTDEDRFREIDRKKRIRSLVVSLDDNSGTSKGYIDPNGLTKKTFKSVGAEGREFHVVSYYTLQDALSGNLSSPMENSYLRSMVPRLSQDILRSAKELKCPPQIERNHIGQLYFVGEDATIEGSLPPHRCYRLPAPGPAETFDQAEWFMPSNINVAPQLPQSFPLHFDDIPTATAPQLTVNTRLGPQLSFMSDNTVISEDPSFTSFDEFSAAATSSSSYPTESPYDSPTYPVFMYLPNIPMPSHPLYSHPATISPALLTPPADMHQQPMSYFSDDDLEWDAAGSSSSF